MCLAWDAWYKIIFSPPYDETPQLAWYLLFLQYSSTIKIISGAELYLLTPPIVFFLSKVSIISSIYSKIVIFTWSTVVTSNLIYKYLWTFIQFTCIIPDPCSKILWYYSRINPIEMPHPLESLWIKLQLSTWNGIYYCNPFTNQLETQG